MSVEIIRVPDTGSSDPADVIEIPVQVGDTIAAEDTIVVLESDKATVEVPAPQGGRVRKLLVSNGDRIKEGDPILELETESEAGGEHSIREQPGEADGVEGEDTGEAAAGDKDASEAAPAAEQDKAAAPPEQSSGQKKVVPVTVPDLGDIESAELIELPVKEGDSVEAEQVIAVLESDKASLEIPAPEAGTVVALKASTGDKLSTGDALLELEVVEPAQPEKDAGQQASTQDSRKGYKKERQGKKDEAEQPAAAQPGGASQEQEQKAEAAPAGGRTSGPVHAGPAVRKLARELGVDLAEVRGSGPRRRILKEDVHAHVNRLLTEKGAAAPAGGGLDLDLPDIDFSRFGEIERVELNRLRRTSATNLHRSWLSIPHVTQHDEADITDLEAFRKEQNQRLENDGVKLTMLAFLVKASAVALAKFPDFNSSLEKSGEALIRKHYIHIGVAVDTPNGLVVPVLRDADSKGLAEIAAEVGELAKRAREKKLSPGEMQGGTFSISSLGGIGGTAFTPIVNWPEVAILGVSRSTTAPRWNGSEFEPRLMLPLSLSYDHRVIDGASAARFTRFIAETLEDLRRALL